MNKSLKLVLWVGCFFLLFLSCTQNIKIPSEDDFSISIPLKNLQKTIVKSRDTTNTDDEDCYVTVYAQIINTDTKSVIQTSNKNNYSYEYFYSTDEQGSVKIIFEPIQVKQNVYVLIYISMTEGEYTEIVGKWRSESFIVEKGENVITKDLIYEFLPLSDISIWASNINSFSACNFYYPKEEGKIYIINKLGYSLQDLVTTDDIRVGFVPIGENQVKLINADTDEEIDSNGYTLYIESLGNYGFILKITNEDSINYSVVSIFGDCSCFWDTYYTYKTPTQQQLESFEFKIADAINYASSGSSSFANTCPYIYFDYIDTVNLTTGIKTEIFSTENVPINKIVYYGDNSVTFCLKITELSAKYLVLNVYPDEYYFEIQKLPSAVGEKHQGMTYLELAELSDSTELTKIENTTYLITFNNIVSQDESGAVTYNFKDVIIENIGM